MILPAIIKGLTLGFILSISVGPVIFAILKQSLVNGTRAGLAFVVGVSLSDIFFVVLANFFSKVLSSSGNVEKIIGVGGSAFLLILGLYQIFLKKAVHHADKDLADKTIRKRDLATIMASGFFMNVLNPGVLLFWFAASAAITNDANAYSNSGQYRFIVFSVCLGFVLLADIAKVFLASKIRNKLTPHNIHRINQLSGLIFIICGLYLLFALYNGASIGH